MNAAFAYVYDDFLSDRRFERDLGLIETELARHGIEGRIVRIALLKGSKDLIRDLVHDGVKNIVFVGNDRTLEKMMWFLPDLDVTVGYLPINGPAQVAELLGIPVGAASVGVLAARLVETLDVGKVNDRYFLTEVMLPETGAALEIEGRYRVSPSALGAIAVRNLGGSLEKGKVAPADPKDGLLEAVIQTRPDTKSQMPWNKGPLQETHIPLSFGAIMSNEPVSVFVDGQVIKGNHFVLSIIPKKLRIVTGRRRMFESTEAGTR